MRQTPAAPIVVGSLLLLFTVWSFVAFPSLDGLEASQRRAARMAVGGLPEETLRRVFVAPPQVETNEEWFCDFVGSGHAEYLARVVKAQFIVTGAVGLGLCVRGALEGRARRMSLK